MRDEQIIAMRLQDISQRQIATNLGIARSTVQNALQVWTRENGPSAEQVEELRQIQAAQIDAMYRDVAPRVMRPLRTEDGAINYEGAGDERKPVVTVDVPVAHLVVKLWERKARLYGLDLERSAAMAAPITREAASIGDTPAAPGAALEAARRRILRSRLRRAARRGVLESAARDNARDNSLTPCDAL
jgi:hypothetical protein